MSSHVIDSTFFKDLYGSAEMRHVFEDTTLLQKWLDFEAALARAEAQVGLIPPEAAAEITRQARAELFDLDHIKRGIDKTAHPLVSIIWQLSHLCTGEAGRYVHWGATTQDVMDTALVLQIKDAYVLFERDLDKLAVILRDLALAHRDTPMAGRTHGQQALPITFGFKVAVWLTEIKRARQRLERIKANVLVGQFAGAVGTLAGVKDHGIAINEALMHEVGLGVPEIGWHTMRDGLAEFACALAMLTATLGKIAHEVVDLQKSEVGEVEEAFEEGRVGSSTMPQKRNPMISQAIVALSRLARTRATDAIDAMLHEHERDWSSMQMDWATLPELCILTHGALTMSLRVLGGLVVHPDVMRRNLDLSGGLILSERVMLELGQHIGRQAAHDLVHECAMTALAQQQHLGAILKADGRVTAHLSAEAIDRLLDPLHYTGLAGYYVDRVL